MVTKKEAIELMNKYANEQENCWKAYDKSLEKYKEKKYKYSSWLHDVDHEARKTAKKLAKISNQLKLKFFIPCVRSGTRYRYVFRPA